MRQVKFNDILCIFIEAQKKSTAIRLSANQYGIELIHFIIHINLYGICINLPIIIYTVALR